MTNPAPSDVVEGRPASGLPRAAWIVVIGALLVSEIGAAARRADASGGGGAWWVVPVTSALLDVLLLYVALRLAHRYPIGRNQPVRHLGVHALAALVYTTANFAVSQWLALAIDPAARVIAGRSRVALGLAGYALWTGVAHGVEYLRRYRASRASALRQRVELADVARHRAEAELRALKAELNPHLLGNALGTVSSLVATDPASAERTLAELGDVMRAALSRATTREVTLGEEIDGLESFLAVQRARFDERLAFEWDIDEALREATVPHMLLHLLIEHALDRVVASSGPTTVRISATRVARGGGCDLRLEIDVANAILERTRPAQGGGDGASAQVRDWLSAIYGRHASLDLDPDPASGVLARLTVPLLEDAQRIDGDDAEGSAQKQRSAWGLPVFLTAWFTALFAFGAASGMNEVLPNGQAMPMSGALASSFLAAAITTAMFYLAIRITRSARPSTWRTHAVAGVAIGLANALGKLAIVSALGEAYPEIPPARLVATVFVVAFAYGIVAAIVHAVEYARRYRGSEAAGLLLQNELAVAGRRRAEAQLRALKAELNPHFLGNALGAVSSLVRSDPAAAQRVLAQIGETLRAAVARVDTQEVTLGEEIEGLTPFLAIERARFGDRLAVSWDVEEAALAVRVPHMILQPLLENAVKHGLSARGGDGGAGGRIVVTGRRAGDQLELSVRDDGVGLRGTAGGSGSARSDGHGGVGLANARARLAELYGSAAAFDLLPAPDSGTIARLLLPWR